MASTCSIVFKDHEFNTCNWKEQLIVGNESTRMMVDRNPNGGREGGGYRQHIQQWGKEGAMCIVSHSNMQATYRPSECGSITSIDFDCSLRNIEHSTETQFALLIEQNNKLYISKQTLPAKRERWSTFSLHNLRRADFARISQQPDNIRDECPNFTFLGGDMQLGYATICTTSEGVTQDEAVSGVDFWRVTVFHEDAVTASQNLRVIQLEHNNNVLLQELSDMHEHAGITRREHITQLSHMHALTEDLDEAKLESDKMRLELQDLRASLHASEDEAHTITIENEQLKQMIADLESAPNKNKCNTFALELQQTIEEEREKTADALQAVNDAEQVIEELANDLHNKENDVERLISENLTIQNTTGDLARKIEAMGKQITILSHERQTVQQALLDTTDINAKIEERLKSERERRHELEHQLEASKSNLKDELKALCTRMEADLARERMLRIQLESDNRAELARMEALMRESKSQLEEQIKLERELFHQKEVQFQEEKRNLTTSLQASTTKGSLVEQRLSTQLLSVSALHKSEVERIAHLEEELKMEKERSSQIISSINNDNGGNDVEVDSDEDWEVVRD